MLTLHLQPSCWIISCALADAVSARIVAVQSSKRVMVCWSLVVGLIADHAARSTQHDPGLREEL
jgi:hypothetical protein